MKYTPIPSELFKKNREKIYSKIEAESLVVIHSADEFLRNGDNLYPFRQNSNFFYLTGIEQEKSILILSSKESEAILFIQETNEQLETWTGKKLSKQKTAEISGIENIYWLTDFEAVTNKLFLSAKTIYWNNDEQFLSQTPDLQNKNFRFKQLLQKKYSDKSFKELLPIIAEARLVKENEELNILKRGCQITEETFFEVLPHIKPFAKEYELEAAFAYGFLSRGASGYSFPPIVASGTNALILHYTENDDILRDNDLVLLDFGCEYANYATDCSRTLPINGIFSKRQKECYEAVWNVYEKAKTLFVEENSIENINKRVAQLMENAMISLGLFSCEDVKNQNLEKPLYKKYYMHGVTHFIGLDAHDVGSKQTPLKAGMILSCEPGIYIKDENIGIRIETMLQITNNQPIDLLSNIPSRCSDIEIMMREIRAKSI